MLQFELLEISDILDDVKQNITDYQYKSIMDLLMPTVAEWSRRTYPAPLGAGGVGSITANSKRAFIPPLAI